MTWALHNSECVAFMRGMGEKSMDVTITDPPYAAAAMKNARSGKTIKKRRDGKEYDFGYVALDDTLRGEAMHQIARVTRRWIVVWCDIESDEAWRQAGLNQGLRYIRTAVWLRENSCPQFSGDRPAQDIEACVIFHAPDVRLRWNGGGRGASHSGPIENSASKVRIHASPKPLWLMTRQVETFSDRGETVFDPFAGSATTGAVCLQLGRNFLGCEMDKKYHSAAHDRLVRTEREYADMQRQEVMFRAPMKQQTLTLVTT